MTQENVEISFDGTDDAGIPAEGTMLAVMITGAFLNTSEKGNTYASLNGQVVFPEEYFGIRVKKQPIMLRTTPEAQLSSNPKFSPNMAQTQAAIQNKEWPRKARVLFELLVGKDEFAEALGNTGNRLTKETLRAIKGAVVWVPAVIQEDNRDGSKYVTFNVVKERTSIEDLGLSFDNVGAGGSGDDEEVIF